MSKIIQIRPFNIFILLLFLVGITRIPRLISIALTNKALFQVLDTPRCNPEWYICSNLTPSSWYPPQKWHGNEAVLGRTLDLLQRAVDIDPNSRRPGFHLAALLFSLGRRSEAAEVLVDFKRYLETDRAGLLGDKKSTAHDLAVWQPGRYEYHLTKARLHTGAGEWRDSVQEYRLGLALGGERILPIDENDFFLAVAMMYKEEVKKNPDNAQAIYLTGKYLARAGHWRDSIVWLEQAIISTGSTGLDIEEQGRAHIYMGVALESLGDPISALEEYQTAIQITPELVEAYVRHIVLSQHLNGEVDELSLNAQLASIGPTYLLGRFGNGYKVAEPAEFDSGWTLLGFEIDKESLANGAPIDLLLWWDGPEDALRPDSNWIQAGNYWFQWQHAINLAPNAGFEWGETGIGLPTGYPSEAYGADVNAISIHEVKLDGETNHALALVSNDENPKVGVRGITYPVDPQSFLLLAGWKTGITGDIGRRCRGTNVRQGPHYISLKRGDEPGDDWIHFASVSIAGLDQSLISECDIFLLNHGSGRTAFFSDLIFVQVKPPGIRK